MLALRISNVLPFIIHEDQTGYIRTRFIGENIRLIDDIISYTSMRKIPGILLAIDFEKAFDTVKWSFIEKTLHAFNFGENFQKWIKVLHTNIVTTVINNGNTSPYFQPKRGIRQGCPLSAFLFILVAELLAHKIRNDNVIEGILVRDRMIKISQLADDTTCFLKNTKSIEQLLYVLNCFHQAAGLKINIEKTKAMYLGSLTGCLEKPFDLCWITGPMECKGVKFTTSERDMYIHNYKDKIATLKNLLFLWSCRKLSLKGKVTVINSLALSPFTYLAQVQSIPKLVIKEINGLIFNFLWDNKRAKVAKDVIIKSIEDGGLKLVDFEQKIKALQLIWVKRMVNNSNGNWKELVKYFYNTDNLTFFFQCKSPVESLDSSIPSFYKDIMGHWTEIHNTVPNTYEEICKEIIWNNKNIRINKKPFLWKTWKESGINFIQDLLDENGQFLSCHDLNTKYDIKCNFLQTLQVRQSLPFVWRQKLSGSTEVNIIETDLNACELHIKNNYVDIRHLKSSDLYWFFINQIKREPACIKKWNEEYHLSNAPWSEVFKLPYKITRETKLQSLQYKIIHRIIPCNVWLKKLKIKESDECDYCDGTDSIEHFFLDCKKVAKFWTCLLSGGNQ